MSLCLEAFVFFMAIILMVTSTESGGVGFHDVKVWTGAFEIVKVIFIFSIMVSVSAQLLSS